MLILVGIIVALFVLLAGGTWFSNKFGKQNTNEEEEKKGDVSLDCCGAHEVCDFEEMLKNPEEITYYEDEDLDRFQTITSNNYTNDQIEEFRDVLYSLHYEEIRKWLLSIERRNIQLPSILKQEALQLIAEA